MEGLLFPSSLAEKGGEGRKKEDGQILNFI